MNKTTQLYSHADLLVWHLINQGGALRPPALLLFSTRTDTLNGCCTDHKQDRLVVKGSTRQFVDCNTHVHPHIHSQDITLAVFRPAF